MTTRALSRSVAAVLVVAVLSAGIAFSVERTSAAEVEPVPNCDIQQLIDVAPQPELGRHSSAYCLKYVRAEKTVLKKFYKWVYVPIPHSVLTHYEVHEMVEQCTVGSKWCVHDQCNWVTVKVTTHYQ